MNPALVEYLWILGSFLVSGALFSIWEWIRPVRKLERRIRFDWSIAALTIMLGILGGALISPLRSVAMNFDFNLSWNLVLRFALFYLLWDGSIYWAHRFMHSSIAWPIHRFHHTVDRLWWLGAYRASLPQLALLQVTFLWFWVVDLPAWLAVVPTAEAMIRDNWTHINVSARWMKYIEWVIVSPRSHSVHHHSAPEYYKTNFGSLFTFWDRIFGTYQNPERSQS